MALDWRSEVAQRMHAHRARRQRLCPDSQQPDLPFGGAGTSSFRPIVPLERHPPPMRAAQAQRSRPRVDRMEIDLAQPALDFDKSASGNLDPVPVVLVSPAASVTERGRAALLDVTLVLLAYGGFLAMFSALGGTWTLSKADLAVTASTLALFSVQYLALFIYCGGATPGMRLRGLRIVTFDGAEPTPRQLSWRCLGYLISGATLLLGFFWAVWDEDGLSWHDRMSQTCVTGAAGGQDLLREADHVGDNACG